MYLNILNKIDQFISMAQKPDIRDLPTNVPKEDIKSYEDEKLSLPGFQIPPEDRAIADKVDSYARRILQDLDSDYGTLKSTGYFNNRKDEMKFYRQLTIEYSNLLQQAYMSPYSFIGKISELLNNKPSISLLNPAKNSISNTNKENMEKIYYEASASFIYLGRELGLKGKIIKAPKISGLKKLWSFPDWALEIIN
jgi:hypothetical protein